MTQMNALILQTEKLLVETEQVFPALLLGTGSVSEPLPSFFLCVIELGHGTSIVSLGK